MTLSLFDDAPQPVAAREVIAHGAVLLRGFVQSEAIAATRSSGPSGGSLPPGLGVGVGGGL